MLIIRETFYQGKQIKFAYIFAKLDIRKYFFALPTVNLWNVLPDGIVGCKMINNFVTKLKCAQLVKCLKGHACIQRNMRLILSLHDAK